MAKVQLLKDKYDKSINAKAELEAELDDLNVSYYISHNHLVVVVVVVISGFRHRFLQSRHSPLTLSLDLSRRELNFIYFLFFC
jgi:hypothetical protein